MNSFFVSHVVNIYRYFRYNESMKTVKDICKDALEKRTVLADDFTAMIKNIEVKPTKNKDTFMVVTLVDNTGEIQCTKWNTPEAEANMLKPLSIVHVHGAQLDNYQGKPQLKINSIDAFTVDNAADPSNYRQTIIPSVATLQDTLKNLILSIKTPSYRQVCFALMNEPDVKEKFMDHPAAKSMHHDEPHGLLFHEVRMMQAADALCNVYTEANRDLLLTACLFHDIGKLDELEPTTSGAGQYTKYELLGHIPRGAMRVYKYYLEGKLSEEEYLLLAHCVLAHHGQLEWGSPVKPMILEARMLHAIDSLDAEAFKIENKQMTMSEGEFSDSNGVWVFRPHSSAAEGGD